MAAVSAQDNRRSKGTGSAWLRFILAAAIISVALLFAFMIGWA